MLKRSTLPFAALLTAALLLNTAAELHGAAPSATESTPTRIILTWTGDPARSQAVTWRTATPLATPQGQITKLNAGPAFEKNARTVPGAASADALPEGRTAGHYAVRFEGLDPETSYCYRVGDGRVWSEWNVFRTAAASPAPFQFIYLGDAQNSLKSLWSRAVRSAFRAAPEARFIAFAGDLLAEGYDDHLWGEWSDALGFISAVMPILPVPGNHDLHRAPTASNPEEVFSVSPLWRTHFALPPNGPEIEEMRGQSYYLDYQGVRFIALDVNVWANDSFEPGARKRVAEKQLAWLTETLSKNPNRWTIVVQHQPMFAMAKGRDYVEMRAALAPLYEKYHVDLVLQGHDHLYSRSHKIAGGKVVDPAAPGVIYAISVSGPKMYQLQNTNGTLMAKIDREKQFYQTIDVAPDRLKYASYAIDGTLADAFELRRSGSSTLYVNGAPK